MVRSSLSSVVVVALALLGAGCSSRPARFADVPPVISVDDHRPVPQPLSRLTLGAFDTADAYVRQNITYALDPADQELALDVNALDEVVLSSWWNPPDDPKRPLDGYRQLGPPESPLTEETGPIASKRPGAMLMRDARQHAYTIIPDPPGRPGLHSSAGVVSSRLLYALGWYVPEAHAIYLADGRTALALAWPTGVDLGPTPPFRARFDDPNDTIARKDRRSLRALPRALGWLAKRDLDVGDLRDAYIGEDPRGFVVHYVMGLEGALGVDALERRMDLARDPDRPSESATTRFWTLGLGAPSDIDVPVTRGPGYGLWGPEVEPDAFDPSPPFEPMRYVTPADDVWIGKQLATLSRATLTDAVRATPLSDTDRNVFVTWLDARRRAMAAWCMARGTPLDPVEVAVTADGDLRVRLVDRAIDSKLADVGDSSWATTLFDGEGDRLHGVADTFRTRNGVDVVVRPGLLRGTHYVVIRITGSRGAVVSPRAMEVHLALAGGKPPRVVGVVH